MGRTCVRWPIGPMASNLQPSQSGTHVHDQENIQLDQSQVPRPLSPTTNPNSNTSQFQDDTLGDFSNKPTTKRKRGPAWPYTDWGTDTKLIVKLNRYNQPIGPTASKLASQLGVIARNGTFCPINYTDWRCKELNQDKERIWADVKNNCEVSDAYKNNCLKSVGKMWRNWKGKLNKEHYSIYDNDKERLKNVPERVDPEQWKAFVKHMGSEMAKMTINDKEPDRLDVYFKTHMKKNNGAPVDQDAAEAIAVIKSKLQEVPETEQTPEFREQVFTDVLGPDTHGRVRTFGLGPCPTEVFGKKNYQFREQHVHDMGRMRAEVREEVREEVRKEFSDRFARIERQFTRLGGQFDNMGYPVPKSPEGPFAPVQEVSDGHSSHH